nr:type I restriction endonuclease [Campylobacter anatolicus]
MTNDNNGIIEKTRQIQEDEIIAFQRDDKSLINLKLIDKKNIHANSLQVLNQVNDKERKNRYDVTILVNGLPLVQIELKNGVLL